MIAITSGTINTGKTLFTIMLLILFLVSEMNSFQDKLSYAFSTQKVKGRVSKALNNIIQEVTQFISIKFIISLATGIIIGTGTFLTGLEFPVVWGFLAFILNFIPTFGSIISSLFTIVFSIIQFYPDISSIVIVTLIIAITQFTLGNILEPRITGSNLGLSPFMILVSLSIWGGIWGFSGFLLAVPTTVIVKIICENVSFLHPIAIFLGNVPGETKKQLSPVDESDTTEETEGSDTTI